MHQWCAKGSSEHFIMSKVWGPALLLVACLGAVLCEQTSTEHSISPLAMLSLQLNKYLHLQVTINARTQRKTRSTATSTCFRQQGTKVSISGVSNDLNSTKSAEFVVSTLT